MIRNLKALLAAALALTAFGAITASAHAADEFHCSAAFENCRGKLSTDGTGTTAHQVIVFENATKTEQVSFTCESLRGTAQFISATDLNLKWNKATGEDREAYDNCKINGTPGVIWHMNECEYTFTAGATGNAAAGRTDEAELHILCPTGQTIEFTIPESTCVFDIGAQTLGGSAAKGGVGYHTIGTTPNREITVTMNLKNMVITKRGNCEALIKSNELIGTYTTGNFLVTAQTAAGAMLDGWFE